MQTLVHMHLPSDALSELNHKANVFVWTWINHSHLFANMPLLHLAHVDLVLHGGNTGDHRWKERNYND